MDWLNIYALGWLVCSALFAFEAAATFQYDDFDDLPLPEEDGYPGYDSPRPAGSRYMELYDDLKDTLSFMSVDSMRSSMLGISTFLLLLDCTGFLLAYQHINRSPLHLALICIIAVIYTMSAIELVLFLYKLFGAFAHPGFDYRVMERYIKMYSLDHLILPRYVGKLASMGKFVVALYLFMTLFKFG